MLSDSIGGHVVLAQVNIAHGETNGIARIKSNFDYFALLSTSQQTMQSGEINWPTAFEQAMESDANLAEIQQKVIYRLVGRKHQSTQIPTPEWLDLDERRRFLTLAATIRAHGQYIKITLWNAHSARDLVIHHALTGNWLMSNYDFRSPPENRIGRFMNDMIMACKIAIWRKKTDILQNIVANLKIKVVRRELQLVAILFSHDLTRPMIWQMLIDNPRLDDTLAIFEPSLVKYNEPHTNHGSLHFYTGNYRYDCWMRPLIRHHIYGGKPDHVGSRTFYVDSRYSKRMHYFDNPMWAATLFAMIRQTIEGNYWVNLRSENHKWRRRWEQARGRQWPEDDPLAVTVHRLVKIMACLPLEVQMRACNLSHRVKRPFISSENIHYAMLYLRQIDRDLENEI